jgi:hypothetical protein
MFGGTVTGEGKKTALLSDAATYNRNGRFGIKAFSAEGLRALLDGRDYPKYP